MAITRRSCGAALKFHLFRTLMVASARFSRLARAESEMAPQLPREIPRLTTSKNISL